MVNSLKDYAQTQAVKKVATPQRERSRADEVVNNAGGFVFAVSDKDRLERFLILGTDGATYYVNSKDQVKESVDFLRKMIVSDERFVVDTIVDVSSNGRAYNNSPAIFAMALVLSEGKDKAYAREAFDKVVRTSTHLFEAAEYVDSLGGWGRAKRKAFANWYEGKDAGALAYQAVKYRQRNGWTHKDVLRLSHAQPDNAIAKFMLGKGAIVDNGVPTILQGFAEMQRAGDEKEVLRVLGQHKNLPWETIPTNLLKSEKVWKTLFYNGQLNGQALIRNITRLAKLGAFKDMQFAADYAARLTDQEMMVKTRLHPINYLSAAVVYDEGQMPRGASDSYYYSSRVKDWTSESVITDALNDGFHLAFKAVEPAGKRTMLAIDVSGSMASSAMGLDLSCAQVAGALAMTVARTEPAHIIRGFTSNGGYSYGRDSVLTDLGISAKTDLATAMRSVQKANWGGTDCSLPMTWALQNRVEVDTFAIITDNDTWAGKIKPFQALRKYRQETGIDARLAVFATSGGKFTIADPSDRGMMDFVGFDSNAPKVFADFSAGRL